MKKKKPLVISKNSGKLTESQLLQKWLEFLSLSKKYQKNEQSTNRKLGNRMGK